jgi:hypothetical protein
MGQQQQQQLDNMAPDTSYSSMSAQQIRSGSSGPFTCRQQLSGLVEKL